MGPSWRLYSCVSSARIAWFRTGVRCCRSRGWIDAEVAPARPVRGIEIASFLLPRRCRGTAIPGRTPSRYKVSIRCAACCALSGWPEYVILQANTPYPELLLHSIVRGLMPLRRCLAPDESGRAIILTGFYRSFTTSVLHTLTGSLQYFVYSPLVSHAIKFLIAGSKLVHSIPVLKVCLNLVILVTIMCTLQIA